MRIGTVLPAIALAVVMGFASAVWAGDTKDGEVKIKTYKMKEKDNARATGQSERWDRGEWTERQTVTVRTDRMEANGRRIQPGGEVAARSMSGPYRYFFTDSRGQYDYFLDHYGYPYQYGGRSVQLPVNVLGYVPPQEIGGGPVRYYRDERPVSWSIFDERGGRID